jgi:hypothetical protein
MLQGCEPWSSNQQQEITSIEQINQLRKLIGNVLKTALTRL